MAQERQREKTTNGGETHTVRISFRATPTNSEKLEGIAQAKGWVNAIGGANVSRVLNFLIEMFDLETLKKKKKEKDDGRG